jgi:hypothetical protein
MDNFFTLVPYTPTDIIHDTIRFRHENDIPFSTIIPPHIRYSLRHICFSTVARPRASHTSQHIARNAVCRPFLWLSCPSRGSLPSLPGGRVTNHRKIPSSTNPRRRAVVTEGVFHECVRQSTRRKPRPGAAGSVGKLRAYLSSSPIAFEVTCVR